MAEEITRARDLAAKHLMTRAHDVDLGDPVITRVERIAAERDRPAVRDDRRSVGYAELAAEARRLAALLERSGAGPGTVVAVGGERGVSVVAAFLAIELVGALYVPADTTWPAARVRDVLRQAGARLLLNVDDDPARSPAMAEGAAEAGVPIVPVADAAGCAPWAGPPRLEAPDQPRYVLFTSGSTGRPKGAVVEHAGMINHLLAKIVDLELTGDDVVAQTAPLGFDISVWQMLCPLLVGGQVHVIGDEVGYDPVAFAAAVDRQGITVVELVPTMVRLLLDDLAAAAGPERSALAGLRWMLATGEELPTEVARRWLAAMPQARLLNAYGPTECSDDVTHHVVGEPDLALLRLPIGTPVINTQLYVLCRDGDGWRACEVDETGELFVGGHGVGRGYLGDPERTAEAFFQDPFADTPTGRLYRTGDAVRLLPQGALQYLGRVDRQVKIAGVRMELGEIEAVLQRHPSVGAVAVVVHRS
ncbi:amino acid adenylation domain-containing protein [Actinomadura scrupuli]|uniref:amino acid adenylation domain-containing protein n=1 Tax=Actinomadura scrupuli TaxID=559629 RepID=UPI003D961DB1